MRIAIDARMYGPSVTGIGNYVKHLTDELFKVDKENEYLMFTLNPIDPICPISLIKVNAPWYSWREQLQLGLYYNRLVRQRQIDLFHFPNFNVPITFRGRFIVTIHDLTPKFFPGPRVKKSPLRKLGYETVFKSALRRAAKIIAVSQHTKDQLVNFHVSPEKIAVVHNGLNSAFQPVTDYGIINKLKNKYGIAKPFIFYTGVWRDHKNLPGLLKGFAILRKARHWDGQLVLGGGPLAPRPVPHSPDGHRDEGGSRVPLSPLSSHSTYNTYKTHKSYSEQLDPLIIPTINQLQLYPHLITPGFIPESELSTFYSAAELTVIPSFCEGFGFLALESLACGTPVAASKTTSVPEILGEAGLYFNPANPQEMAAVMAAVLQNQNLREELVTKGKEIIKKYSWETCARQTLEIYQKISERL